MWRLRLSASHEIAPMTFRPVTSVVAAAQNYISYEEPLPVAAAATRAAGSNNRFASQSTVPSRSLTFPNHAPTGPARSGSAFIICFNCLGVGHDRLSCPNLRFVGCHRCLQPGHVSRDCTAPRPVQIDANSVTPVRRVAHAHLRLASEAPDNLLDSDITTALVARDQASSSNISGSPPPLPPAVAGGGGAGTASAVTSSAFAGQLMTAEAWCEEFNITDSHYSYFPFFSSADLHRSPVFTAEVFSAESRQTPSPVDDPIFHAPNWPSSHKSRMITLPRDIGLSILALQFTLSPLPYY